nr:hypothetical protein [Tanacetum cinerariifolium]
MDVPLLLDHVFDFFAAEPVPGLAEAPDNQNEEELNEFMDDDQDEEVEEWLMALVTPSRATVIDDLCVRMSNLEYRHEELNALQAMLPRIREEIREEFRTGPGSSNAGG